MLISVCTAAPQVLEISKDDGGETVVRVLGPGQVQASMHALIEDDGELSEIDI